VGTGRPAEIAGIRTSVTAAYLRQVLVHRP